MPRCSEWTIHSPKPCATPNRSMGAADLIYNNPNRRILSGLNFSPAHMQATFVVRASRKAA
jgi:hypothetical protein